MRWRAALSLAWAAGVLGCGSRETAGRPRLWTLFDLAALADQGGGAVAVGGSLPGGLPVSNFLIPRSAAGGTSGGYELAVSPGWIDGLSAAYVTTELWANVEEIWAQPLYRAVDAQGVVVDDPTVQEPWVFGVGPHSSFYSPFWAVSGFRVPPGADVTAVRDVRAVLQAAAAAGADPTTLEPRVTSLAPANVRPPSAWIESVYYDDAAAWDGAGGRRYLDLGPGRFETDATGVVREFPLFVFTQRTANGTWAPVSGWPTVGGTRALFAAPPAAAATGSGAGGSVGTGVFGPVNPQFGGLWRLHTVALAAEAGLAPDGRVVADVGCLNPGRINPCVPLDTQAAVEGLGEPAIRRTEFLAACPLLQLGDVTFPRNLQPPPKPVPPP